LNGDVKVRGEVALNCAGESGGQQREGKISSVHQALYMCAREEHPASARSSPTLLSVFDTRMRTDALSGGLHSALAYAYSGLNGTSMKGESQLYCAKMYSIGLHDYRT